MEKKIQKADLTENGDITLRGEIIDRLQKEVADLKAKLAEAESKPDYPYEEIAELQAKHNRLVAKCSPDLIDKSLQHIVIGTPSPIEGVSIDVHDTRRKVATKISQDLLEGV